MLSQIRQTKKASNGTLERINRRITTITTLKDLQIFFFIHSYEFEETFIKEYTNRGNLHMDWKYKSLLKHHIYTGFHIHWKTFFYTIY
uniref:Uncharacterized protein n=1 Tax=Rhizophora mucronata TaxID=61149 RepID=A0A2P2KYV5_RHIMU